MRSLKITVVFFAILLAASNLPASAQDPCGSHFQGGLYFTDIEVTETITRRKMTISEVMDLLDRQPNVKSVLLHTDPRRPFSIETLAYPQCADRYALTEGEWRDLQAYCREKLRNPIAVDGVIAHWRSIVNGKPPFGLRVQSR